MARHVARKRFGQNFLRDESVIRALVEEIAPRAEQHLVEIGPGQGALTERLLEKCSSLDLVEIDRDLVAVLESRFQARQGLVIHLADALTFDFRKIARGEATRLRIVGNLPYNISTPLLFRLFDQLDAITDMHFMLQKEVVERLCAAPGSANYGRLSVMARYYCEAEPLFDVAPNSFFPSPKVMSSVIRLIPYLVRPVATDVSKLRQVVSAAFGQRRKTLRNSLRAVVNDSDLLALGIDPRNRAQDLDLTDYARIADLLVKVA